MNPGLTPGATNCRSFGATYGFWEVPVARTPLFNSLVSAFRLAALAARRKPNMPSADELLDITYTRRRFLRDSALATAAVASATLGGSCSREAAPPQSGVQPSQQG